jgi:hypothetical protein
VEGGMDLIRQRLLKLLSPFKHLDISALNS